MKVKILFNNFCNYRNYSKQKLGRVIIKEYSNGFPFAKNI